MNPAKKVFLAICVVTLFCIPLLALAQDAPVSTNPCSIKGFQGQVDTDSTLPRCINQIYLWSLGIGALLALLMVVLGGYNYMTSAGNAEQANKGKEMIWGAVIGLVLLFGAYLILNTINPDLVRFNFSTEELNPGPAAAPPANTPGNIRE